MKRTSDVTILGTVVYGVSISTTTFTLRSRMSLGSTQMNNQSKASKSDLPRSLQMKKIFNGCLLHGGVDPLSYFSFQPVLNDWCNKGRGMCYPVCGMVHIKEPLLSIEKSSPRGGSRFPLSLSEWSFTICPTPYNRR